MPKLHGMNWLLENCTIENTFHSDILRFLACARVRVRHRHARTRALHRSILTHVYTGFMTPRGNVVSQSQMANRIVGRD